MSLKVYNGKGRGKRGSPSRTAPLRLGEFGDASVDLERVEFGESDPYDEDLLPGKPPEQYYEAEWETTTVRCCGAFVCVLLGVFVLSWIVHAIPVSTINDIPPFARSLIWMSLAHHTDAWKSMNGGVSPPPPAFGDGLGNFPDQ